MTGVARILVVDDELQIRRALRTNLLVRGYDVLEASTGSQAVIAATDHAPDLVLLDLGLPDLDGIEVLHGIRLHSDVPVIVLTVRDRESDKVEALDAGADDYVTKPFGMNELLARMRAQLRRTPTDALDVIDGVDDGPPTVVTAAFTVDRVVGHVSLPNGSVVRLTPKEWGIVDTLARNAGRLVTQRHLLHAVWGDGYSTETNYLRVFMAQIRKKLEPDPNRPVHFVTEPGIGYRLEGVEGIATAT